MKAEIRSASGTPTLYIDGEPQIPLLLFTNTEIDGGARRDICGKEIRMAAAQGFHLHSVCCHIDVGEPRGLRSLETAIEAMNTAIRNDPQAKVLLRVNVSLYGAQALAWERRHPGDGVRFALHTEHCRMEPDGHGGYLEVPDTAVSIASDAWLDAAVDTVRELCAWMEAHPAYNDHLLGYHIAAATSGEWFHEGIREYGVDISEANQRAYRRWLAARYGTIEALDRAWGLREGAHTAFEQLSVPADIPGNDREQPPAITLFVRPEDQRYIDYGEYASDIVIDRILKLARAAREATHADKLLLFFYGYHFELYDARTGHFRLNALLESPDIDAFASPISYLDRNEGGTGAPMAPVDSIALHGKLWLVENDLRTGQVLRAHSDRDHASWINTPIQSLEGVREVYRREAAHMLAHGMGCWYMDLMARGWLSHPRMWEDIAQIRALYTAVGEDRTLFHPDVAVIVDEQAAAVIAHAEQCGARLLHTLRQNMYRAGMKCGWYTVEDVEEGWVPSARLLFFLTPFRMDAGRCAKLRMVAERQQAAMVFLYGFGTTDPALVRELTGMQIVVHGGSLENLAMEAPDLMPAGSRFLPAEEDMVRQIACPVYWDAVQRANPAYFVEPTEDVRPLAWYTAGQLKGKIGAALCRREGHSVVFVGAMQLTAAAIREIGRLCGVHIYCETEDVLIVGDHILAVHTQRPDPPAWAAAAGRTVAGRTPEQDIIVRLKESLPVSRDGTEPAADTARLTVKRAPATTYLWTCREGRF